MAQSDPLNAYNTSDAQLTQQASPGQTAQPQASGGIIGSAIPPAAAQPAAYNPVARDVDKATETVQGQVDSVLAKDGPLFERARALALEEGQRRGLVNSSMAVGAAQGAVLDKALQIATPDASTYSRVASENADAKNTAGQFNANAQNQFGLQGRDQSFQAGEAGKTREFQGAQAGLDRDQQVRLQQLQEAGVQNRFDKELAMRDTQFNVEQAAQDRRLAQQQANALEQLGFQNRLNNENVPSNFAAGVSSTTMERVNAIMADPNLDATAKRNAIQNVVDYANSTMAWAETFYKTTLPRLSVPGGAAAPAPTPAPAGPSKTTQPVTPWVGMTKANPQFSK